MGVRPSSCSRLDDLTTFSDHLLDLLILMRQQAQRISDVVPLALTLRPLKSRSELAGELLGMLILYNVSALFNQFDL